MDKERVRKIGLSLAAAAKRNDEDAVVKWASYALAEVLPAPEINPERLKPLTWDGEYAIFLDAADEWLKAAGKPYGREGAERGAMPLGVLLDICEEHDLPLMLAKYRALVDPGVTQ